MEPGTLELQVFVSLIVILGTAFVALVCDYLKGSNEHLREHNIELRVRKEEQERHRPVEAVEWLQHLMGARQGSGIRFGGTRVRKPQAVAKTGAESATAEIRRAAHHREPGRKDAALQELRRAGEQPVRSEPVRRDPAPPAATAASVNNPTVAVARTPVPALSLAKAIETRPLALPPSTGLPAATPPVESINEDRPRTSRVMEARARREATGTLPDNSILANLPLPAWLKKERESTEKVLSVLSPELTHSVPAANVEVAAETPAAAEPEKKEKVWTYRGLLDQVVAATGHRGAEPETQAVDTNFPAVPATVGHATHLVETVAESQADSSPHFVTVAIEIPNAPMQDNVEAVAEIRSERENVAAESNHGMPVVLVVEETPTDANDYSAWTPDAPGAPFDVQAVADVSAVAEDLYAESAPEVIEQFQDQFEPTAPMQAIESYDHPEAPEHEVPEMSLVETVSPHHELVVPAGFHDRQVLDELLKATEVISGVVVAIGINDYALHSEKMGRSGMQQWMESVEAMIRSLLLDKDFGCHSSEDEFVLVFPDETGAAAQKRLNTISERLWSFQLRSLGAFSVMFSWGAVEIQGETLADAAASASERMYQTKRNRKTISMESGRPRKAVNL